MSGINGQQFEGSYLGDRSRLPPDSRLFLMPFTLAW